MPSPSRSEYLPTRMMQSCRGSVLEVAPKVSDGLVDRESAWGTNRIVGVNDESGDAAGLLGGGDVV